MALSFKPLPGLTVATVIGVGILMALGVWQYQRWHWKMDYLAEVEAAVTAPPLSGLSALAALPDDAPLAYRRIEFDGTAIGPSYHLYSPEAGIAWQPFRVVEADGSRILVGFETIDDVIKDTASTPQMGGPRAGYIRPVEARTGLARLVGAANNPDDNRWFEINPDGAWLPDAAVWIDVSARRRSGADLPVLRPDVPNNHVSYMLTWWSFANILLIVSAILHVRAGRLSWGRRDVCHDGGAG